MTRSYTITALASLLVAAALWLLRETGLEGVGEEAPQEVDAHVIDDATRGGPGVLSPARTADDGGPHTRVALDGGASALLGDGGAVDGEDVGGVHVPTIPDAAP